MKVLTYQDVTNVDSVGIITAQSGINCGGDLDITGQFLKIESATSQKYNLLTPMQVIVFAL